MNVQEAMKIHFIFKRQFYLSLSKSPTSKLHIWFKKKLTNTFFFFLKSVYLSYGNNRSKNWLSEKYRKNR